MKRRYTPMQRLNWRLRKMERQLAAANHKLDLAAWVEHMKQEASIERGMRRINSPPGSGGGEPCRSRSRK